MTGTIVSWLVGGREELIGAYFVSFVSFEDFEDLFSFLFRGISHGCEQSE